MATQPHTNAHTHTQPHTSTHTPHTNAHQTTHIWDATAASGDSHTRVPHTHTHIHHTHTRPHMSGMRLQLLSTYTNGWHTHIHTLTHTKPHTLGCDSSFWRLTPTDGTHTTHNRTPDQTHLGFSLKSAAHARVMRYQCRPRLMFPACTDMAMPSSS
jgi:hypothetical protein